METKENTSIWLNTLRRFKVLSDVNLSDTACDCIKSIAVYNYLHGSKANTNIDPDVCSPADCKLSIESQEVIRGYLYESISRYSSALVACVERVEEATKIANKGLVEGLTVEEAVNLYLLLCSFIQPIIPHMENDVKEKWIATVRHDYLIAMSCFAEYIFNTGITIDLEKQAIKVNNDVRSGEAGCKCMVKVAAITAFLLGEDNYLKSPTYTLTQDVLKVLRSMEKYIQSSDIRDITPMYTPSGFTDGAMNPPIDTLNVPEDSSMKLEWCDIPISKKDRKPEYSFYEDLTLGDIGMEVSARG